MWHAQTHAYNVEGSGKAKWQEESHCLMSHWTHAQMHFGGVPATASWQSPLTRISRNQGSEPSNAMIIAQSDVVADMTRSNDKLNLIPGNAGGTATPEGIPHAQIHIVYSPQ